MYFIYGCSPNLTYVHFYQLDPGKRFRSRSNALQYLYSCGFKRTDIRKLGIFIFKWEGSAPDWFEVGRDWEGWQN